jgi:hypothetical protein
MDEQTQMNLRIMSMLEELIMQQGNDILQLSEEIKKLKIQIQVHNNTHNNGVEVY